MKLHEVAVISAGHSFRGKIPELKGSGLYAVQLKDVTLSGINWKSCISTKVTGKVEPKFLLPSDILFAARGNNNYAVLVDQIPAQQKAVASPHFYVVKANINKILPEFLAWLLNQRVSQRYFQREAEGSSSKSIRRNILENIEIILPNMARQQQIIKLVTTINKEQDALQQLIDNGNKTMAAIATKLMNEHSQG